MTSNLLSLSDDLKFCVMWLKHLRSKLFFLHPYVLYGIVVHFEWLNTIWLLKVTWRRPLRFYGAPAAGNCISTEICMAIDCGLVKYLPSAHGVVRDFTLRIRRALRVDCVDKTFFACWYVIFNLFNFTNKNFYLYN